MRERESGKQVFRGVEGAFPPELEPIFTIYILAPILVPPLKCYLKPTGKERERERKWRRQEEGRKGGTFEGRKERISFSKFSY